MSVAILASITIGLGKLHCTSDHGVSKVLNASFPYLVMIIILAADLILKKRFLLIPFDQQSPSYVNPLTRSIIQRMFSFDCRTTLASIATVEGTSTIEQGINSETVPSRQPSRIIILETVCTNK